MDIKQDFKEIFWEEAGLKISSQVPLARYSNFKIGGPADYFYEAKELVNLIKGAEVCRKYRLPFYVIGGGYNLLFDDEGYKGLIIRNLASMVKFIPGTGRVEVHSGAELGAVVDLSISEGLSGLEFLAGIPGTVGGAIYGNAGAFGQAIGDQVEQVSVLGENGEEIILKTGEIQFAYRHSSLKKDHKVILRVWLRVEPDSKATIENKIKDYLAKRASKHPPQGTACAGSYFKNPVLPDGRKIAAGRLLEEAGARDLRVGAAAVFSGHCNFIINLGGASARDVLTLAAELKERVRKKSGFTLEEEVIYVPATASML
ncbi:MAG: UDP-N-acetylmuramate dehydrogenase [Candidatus Saccharicenans sp.]